MAVKPLWTITYGFSDEATFADQVMHVLAESAGEAIDEFERHIALESEPQIRSVARSTTTGGEYLMPYIDQPSRRRLDAGSDPSNVGELTYVVTLDTLNGRDAEHITHVLVRYVESQGRRFQTFAEILGSLEATKLELCRRRMVSRDRLLLPLAQLDRVKRSFYNTVIGPYEDSKILSHGDIF